MPKNVGLVELLMIAVPCLFALLIIVAAIVVLVLLLNKRKKAQMMPAPAPDRVGEPAAFPPDASVLAPAEPDAPPREPPGER